jgi:SAM-dependent methyltransferase
MPHPSPKDAFRAFEAARWERIPGVYDDFFGPITARAIDPLLDLAGVGARTRVLDVAAGPGHVAGRAAARGAAATGVDLAPAMVALARRRYPEVEFQPATAEALPFPDGAFDAVVCSFGLGHFADPAQALAEAARVLAPRGRVALSWWGAPEESPLLGVFHDAIARVGAAPPPGLPPGPPFFRYSVKAALCALLDGAGLRTIELEQVAFVARFANAEALWSGVIGSSVRTAAAILGQPEAKRQEIRAVFADLVAAYTSEDGLAIPVVMKLAAATSEGYQKVGALPPAP